MDKTELSSPFRPVTTYEQAFVTTLASGQDLVMPIHRLEGSRPGPTLGLVAVLHGDESLPNEIIRRVLSSVGADELAGSIIAVPTGNGPALETLSRNSPADALDLNRSFPGNAQGWLTEQLAHSLAQLLLGEVDLLIDLHSGGLFAAVDYVYMTDEGRELALALGCQENFVTANPHPGGLLGVARQAGIPAVILEIGGGHIAEERFIRKGVAAITNALRHYKMLGGAPCALGKQVIFDEISTIRPTTGGILYPEVGVDRLGTPTEFGELLGRVVSPLSYDVLEELRSPFELGHIVLVRSGLARINPGDFAYMVTNSASAVEVSQ